MNVLARDAKQLGHAIRRVRRQLALSQAALGEKTGLRQETISLIESGNASTRVANIFAILAALGLEFQVAPRAKGWKEEEFL